MPGIIIVALIIQFCSYYSGLSKQASVKLQATLIESCDRSPDCQNYFKNPPAPPPLVIPGGFGGQTTTQPAPPGSSDYTPETWAITLLTRMGYPATGINLRVVEDWEAAEGGHWRNTARFNPLNTTQQEPGSSAINSVGVQAYTSWGQGFQATITTLKYSAYSDILRQLAINNCESCIINAIVSSPWGTKHIGA